MAITDEGVSTPVSTNAVPTPGEVAAVQEPGHPESTGAVPTPGPVTHEFGDLGTTSTGVVTTPGAWKVTQDAGVKVINAPRRAAAEGQTTAETEQPASGRRAAAPAEDSGH
jgi:hypothetical protein